MQSKLPIKKLIILNFWMTSYFMLFGFVSTMANLGIEGIHKAITNSLLGGAILIINSFGNLALLRYFERHLLFSKTGHKKRFAFLSYFFSFLIYIVIIFVYTLVRHSALHLSSFIYVTIICILINTLILAFQNFIIMYDARVSTMIENSQLKAAHADAVNQLLRRQIHPHFLFNALNILKSLYKVNAKLGEVYLIRLSDFLRAAVSSNNNKVILLKDELKLCIDYLEMQKIRFDKALLYTIDIKEQTAITGWVPSFSIQPLLENAIKHNELTEESPLHIEVRQENDRIIVVNSLKPKISSETSTGSGLSNLSERYKLLSNDELIIEENTNTFSVSIKILSHENSNN